ncbi:MAG TPA: hypothetical protein VF432_32055 [Thermoanaerobaculia bacterium]
MSAADGNALDVESLGKEMLDAARAAVAGRAKALQVLAEMEIRRLADVLADIAGMLAKGEIDRDRAKTLVRLHRRTVSSVLRSVEGLGILAADDALKAVTRVAGAAVNRLLGFKLL